MEHGIDIRKTHKTFADILRPDVSHAKAYSQSQIKADSAALKDWQHVSIFNKVG